MVERLPDPAPALAAKPESASILGKGDTLQNKKEMRCGTNTQHPKTDIVVAIVRIVVVTVSRARIVLIVDPRPAAQDALVARLPQVQLPVLESILSE